MLSKLFYNYFINTSLSFVNAFLTKSVIKIKSNTLSEMSLVNAAVVMGIRLSRKVMDLRYYTVTC